MEILGDADGHRLALALLAMTCRWDFGQKTRVTRCLCGYVLQQLQIAVGMQVDSGRDASTLDRSKSFAKSLLSNRSSALARTLFLVPVAIIHLLSLAVHRPVHPASNGNASTVESVIRKKNHVCVYLSCLQQGCTRRNRGSCIWRTKQAEMRPWLVISCSARASSENTGRWGMRIG